MFKWLFTAAKQHKVCKPVRYDITEEQRDLIRRNFPTHNANITWTGERNGQYVLPDSVKAYYGKGILTFRNTDNILRVSVAYHRSMSEALDRHCVPLFHIEYDATDGMLETIKGQLMN